MEYIRQLLNSIPKKKRSVTRYIKPDEVKKLEKDYKEYHYKNRDIPFRCDFKFRDDTANGLTKCICSWLKMNGYFSARVNTTGTYNPKLKRFVHSGATKGMADITAIINGKHLSIEVKAGKDRPREAQLLVQEQVTRAGGIYIFVRTFADFLKQVMELGFTENTLQN